MPLTQVSSRLIEDTLRYVLGASGTDHYTFTGKGLTGAVNDPTLTLSRGHTYIFENRSGGHPFYIKTSIANGGTNDAYNTGVTNNGGGNGTEIVFTVPHDAPDTLYYQCSSHSSMAGQLSISGSVADGSITTAKLADDAVTTAKIAANAVTAAEIQSNTIQTGNIVGGAITTDRLADDAVTAAKLASDAVVTASIVDANVTTAKIADSAVTDAKINSMAASKLTGALPAISGGNLTGIPVGINISYAQLQDVKGSGTQGGSFTNGGWRTRDLNTEQEDTDNIVTLSSNQFTLGAGNYHISAHACAVGVNNHAIRLYSITNNAIVIMGFSHKNQEENVSEYARLEGRVILGGNMVFEIQHQCSTTVTTHGFGAYHGFADNVYTTVQIYKRNY